MKRYLLSVLLLAISLTTVAQNAKAPAYLLQQDFPDSVKTLKLLAFSGEEIEFSDIIEKHKGKKIVIDLWASWCRDCIIGLPKLESLKQKTGEVHTTYIFISVDEQDLKWRNAITRFDIRGEHYRINKGWHNTLSNYIELDWVPRYLVLNEQGRIIMPKAITADEEELVKVFDSPVTK